MRRFELPQLSLQESKSCVSTDSTTLVLQIFFFGTRRGIRTRTVLNLSQAPLPVGVDEHKSFEAGDPPRYRHAQRECGWLDAQQFPSRQKEPVLPPTAADFEKWSLCCGYRLRCASNGQRVNPLCQSTPFTSGPRPITRLSRVVLTIGFKPISEM